MIRKEKKGGSKGGREGGREEPERRPSKEAWGKEGSVSLARKGKGEILLDWSRRRLPGEGREGGGARREKSERGGKERGGRLR